MTPSANIASIVVLAGFGIAAGIAALYHYLTTQNSEEEQHRYRRRSPSPSARSSQSPFPIRRRPRAISPPRETQTIHQTAQTSDLGNGVRRRAEAISICILCSDSMLPDTRTIGLDCAHVFHDECYTVWRFRTVMYNPHANLCPSC